MNGHIVIVGAGQAGVQAAEALRSGGFTGELTLLGDEVHGPYHRPPLSKGWLSGDTPAAQLVMRTPEVLTRKQITLRTGVTVTAVDREARAVRLADGETLHYTGLVLATGATPRMLPVPGGDAANVLVLRTREQSEAIARHFESAATGGQSLVVVGGGFIGLEVAATARAKGLPVTVLEAAPRLLSRVLSPELSDWFSALHRGHGVEIVCDARITGIEVGHRLAEAVTLADGRRVPAGLVLVGIGVTANDRLAAEAGLACDRGILVDEHARTSDPLIVAAGDCTARRLPDGTLLRLESVNNATEQAKAAAASLLGQSRPFVSTPWFWSDQYDRKLQMAGLPGGADRHVLRGAFDGPGFSIFHFRAGSLVAVDSVNAPRDHLAARRLMDAGRSPTPEQAADVGFDLSGLLKT